MRFLLSWTRLTHLSKSTHPVGSGWVVDRVELLWLDIASYEPFQGGSYIQLSSALGNKRVMVNKDDSCSDGLLDQHSSKYLGTHKDIQNILKKD